MTQYIQQPYPWVTGSQPFNPGISGGPRISAIGEHEANCPKPWPSAYRVPLFGVGAMPLFVLGVTQPVFNNQFSPAPYGYMWQIPGIARTPFG